MWIIPFLAAALYLLGGQVNKLFRWLMGIPIGLIAFYFTHDWWNLLAVVTFLVATNIFSYGDNNWTSKLFGRWVSMGLAGLTYGLASIVILVWWMALIQAVVGCVAFLVLKWLDDSDILKNPWQELLRGFTGTILMVFA